MVNRSSSFVPDRSGTAAPAGDPWQTGSILPAIAVWMQPFWCIPHHSLVYEMVGSTPSVKTSATLKMTLITAILPGVEAPTIVPLHGRPGHFAIHAVCQESVFWETLQKLKSAGASAILVVPIEKMMM